MGSQDQFDRSDHLSFSSTANDSHQVHFLHKQLTTTRLSPTNVTPSFPEMTRIILNVTSGTPLNYVLPLLGYLMPFLLIITIIANTLVVIVLSKKHMRSPTNLVLMAMAISDTLTIIFPAPWYFYLYTLGKPTTVSFYFAVPITCCLVYIQDIKVNISYFEQIPQKTRILCLV